MPNPRAQRPLSLQAVTEDIRSLAQPAQAMLDMLAGAAKGSISATAGLGGDIRELINLLGEDQVKQLLGERSLPTTEEVSAFLPAVVPPTAPLSRQQSAQYGQTMGEFLPTPGSGEVVKGLTRGVLSLPKAVQHGALEFAKASAAGAPHVVKPKGGNWIDEGFPSMLQPLKTHPSLLPPEHALKMLNERYTPEALAAMPEDLRLHAEHSIKQQKDKLALDRWVDRNLTNYIKNEMGTEGDPIRKLAEQGILHKNPELLTNDLTPQAADRYREMVGGKQMAKSDAAKAWENASDVAIEPLSIEDFAEGRMFEGMVEPWMKKVPAGTKVYGPAHEEVATDLGFDHIVDILRQDLAAGRIRPEQLSKVSMEQAVRRTYEFDQEMAKKMREAQIKATEGFPVHKEYPEGYKWIELNAGSDISKSAQEYQQKFTQEVGKRVAAHPGDKSGKIPVDKIKEEVLSEMGPSPAQRLEEALKYEGETMGHCVGGYCPDVLEGRSRIYSLRDARGEPHVTVEVSPASIATQKWLYDQPKEIADEIFSKVGQSPTTREMAKAVMEHPKYQEDLKNAPQQIVQIKGKQNRAPKEEYLPYVQDFVKGGQWSQVGDLGNTGLRRYETPEGVKYVTESEYSDELLKELGLPPGEGMKRGGKVHISDNPDTMQLELAGGGLTKLARLARAPAKSKEEIRAVAERIAPQLTGEFVRGEKGTQSVAGKTQKQFAREKELKHDIRGEMPAPGTIDYEKLKDQVVIGIPGDPTITGKSVHAVGETPLESPSPQHGGPLYGLGRDDDHFWASQLGAARRVQNLAREAGQQYDQPVLGQYIMMGPESINYAQHFADANLSAIDPTKMTKRQIEGFNKLLREGSPASGPRPSFPGIENKEDAYLYMAVDPELRKHFNALMQMPTVTQHFGLPSGIDVRHAVTEPALRDLETGVTGYSVGQMRPEIEDLKLSSHPTYSHDIPGHFLGQSRQPIPYEIMFPDTLQAIRGNPKQAPHEFGSLKMVGPRQTIDQQLIDEIKMYEEMVKKLTGKAAGGAISKAALTAMERLKELKAEAALKSDVWKAKQAADEAKYTQDIQPMTPEMMRAEIDRMQNPVKKATGGEITADDLILEERPL